MKNKRKGRIIAISVIVLLVGAILGIIKLSNVDKYAGLVKVKNASLSSISTKLAANISDLTEENEIYTKGYDEIDYTIKYRLSQVPGDRDVIINGKVDENDPYASFKEVTGENITSVLSSDRKEITVTIKNLPADEEITSKLTLLIENAPRGYTVSPKVRIKESTSEEYTNIAVKSVTVNTNSLQGLVIDEDGNKVPNILISLKKNEEIIKETYTNSEGIYTFSDITPDTYKVVVNEEIYENLEVSDLYIEEGNVLNLIVKRVYPYKIETNKYITKVELNNLGSSKDYLYDDVELANIPVKRVNNLHGKVYYKIVVQNTGEKEGIISSVKDELPEGLSFDEKLNSGYELKNGIIYNRNLEGKELKAGEQIQDTLVLTIENTDIAKTYINKVNARGELYEHVVYLLNGKQYKTLDVLEGEQLDKLEVSNPNFKGWYTDEKLTNLYNYDNPVEKDLILYGVTAKKHKVIFNDKHPETGDITKYDEQDVPNGEPVDKPTPDPSKEGYTFCGWDKDDNTHWDFNTPVTSDLTLTSCYNINEYTVEFYDNSMNDGGDFELISTLTKEYKSVLSNAEAPVVNWEGHNFLKWTTDPEGQHEYDFTKQIKNNIKLYAQYTLQDRLFIFNDENRITEKTVEYGGTVQAIADQGKEGHTFKYWSLTSPSSQEEKTPFDFTTKIYQTTTVYAIYEINVYDVVFNDVDPLTDTQTEYTRERVPHGDKATEPDPEPSKEGFVFCGWLNGNTPYDFDTRVTSNLTLTACYQGTKVTVRFMDGENLFASKEVDYGSKVTTTDTFPIKEHHIFKFWSEDNQTGFDFDNTIIKTNKTLYSVYEEIEAPTITHTPLYWTNDRVVVTITSPNPNYGIKYKVDDGSYQTYTEPFELETNSTIIAKSIYGEAESVITSHEVTNIDKLNPVIGTITPIVTENSATFVGSMTDGQSGVKVINFYKDNVYAGSVDGTVINEELRDYTKEKNMNFTLNGLVAGTDYTIKIEVVDGAGNKSETTLQIHPEQEIICQIISVDGVDLNEEDYIPFPLLASAIADSHCDSKCTIQMLKGTLESVEILETQDITLDLNGKTVSGVLPGYTVSNNGEFTLVDHAQDTNGGLINTNGIAILNNTRSKLTLGEGSSEPPTGSESRTVSTSVPFVFGETYGIYSENNTEFAFFDGLVRGAKGTPENRLGAIYGEVTETEYSYNASSNEVNQYEEVSLAQLDDPEARINKSIYYSNVANAVADASQGGTKEMQDTPATFLSGFTHRVDDESETYSTVTGYKFAYNAEHDTLTSTNDYYGSVSFSETVVDLTEYQEDQLLGLEYQVTLNDDESKGTPKFCIKKLDDNFNEIGSCISRNWSLSKNDSLEMFLLEKGYRYKVEISFTQPVYMTKGVYTLSPYGGSYNVTSPGPTASSQLVVTRGYLLPQEKANETYTEYSPTVDMPGFSYDSSTNTIRSNNAFKSNVYQYAYSFIELDLTNKTGDYDIFADAYIEGAYNSSSSGRIYISENEAHYPSDKYSNDCLLYIDAYGRNNWSYGADEFYDYPSQFYKVGPFNGVQTVQGGKKYYINLYYYMYIPYSESQIIPQTEFEQYGITPQFVIKSLKVVKSGTSESVDIPNNLVGDAFDTDAKITYWDGLEYYGKMNANIDDYYDSYLKIDLTDSAKDKIIEIDQHYYSYNFVSVYLTSNNKGLSNNYINSHRQDMIMFKDDYSIVTYPYTYGNRYWGQSGSTQNKYLLEKGNVYYLHFNTQLGYSSTRTDYKGENYDCENNYYCGSNLRGINIKDADDVIINFGQYPINVGTESYDSLPEDSNTITLSDNDQITVKNEAVGYTYDSNTNTYTISKPLGYYQTGIEEFTIDLTNETETQMYYLTSNRNTYYSDSYVMVDQSYPYIYGYSYGKGWNFPYTYVSENSFFSLEPGHVYYFRHISYNSSTNPSSNATDSFKVEKITGEKTNEYTKAENIVTFNEDVDEIQILKDIQLVDSIVIDRSKEAILDLNGYKISSSLSTPIIDNYGKLTVIDSDYENQTSENKTHNGILESSAGNVINNNQNAELRMKNFDMKVNGAKVGINNDGKLEFVSGCDSKIYVTARNAKGISNNENGYIENAYSSLEIVMNFLNQANFNYYLHNNYEADTFNTGLYNAGYANFGGLKVSGKNGKGIYNHYKGVLILRTVNIGVDINEKDKQNYLNNDINDYSYYRSRYYYPIMDATVHNYSGSQLTITDGSTVSYRIINDGEMYISNGTPVTYLKQNNSGSLYLSSGGNIKDATLYGKTVIAAGGSVQDKLENYGDLHIVSGSFNPTNTSSVVNNRGGIVTSANTSYYVLNNYGNGTMRLNNGSAKHIINEGKEITLNSFSVNTSDTSFEEAVKNSGILNLEHASTINGTNGTGVLMSPLVTTNTVSFYDRHNRKKEYTTKTYKQIELNIGTDLTQVSSNSIIGWLHAVAGPCYYEAKKELVSDSLKDTVFIQPIDGEIEAVSQSKYDQTFCIINMYSGNIMTTGYPDLKEYTMDLPITNTQDDTYAYWNNGLHVIPGQYTVQPADDSSSFVAKIGSKKFARLKDAIDSVTTNDPVTIDVYDLVEIRPVEIPEGRNITLNFVDGHESYIYSDRGLVVNNGTLNVQGPTTSGYVNTFGKYGFVNNGTFTSTGRFKNLYNSSGIIESALLKNNGTATINNGAYVDLDFVNTKTLTANSADYGGTMFYGQGAESVTTVKGGRLAFGSVPTRLDYLTNDDGGLRMSMRHIFELSDGATAILDNYDNSTVTDITYFRPIAHLDNSTIELRNSNISIDTNNWYTRTSIIAENNSNVIFNGGHYEQMYANIDSSTITVNDGDLTGTDSENLIYMHGITPVANINGGNLVATNNTIGISDYTKDVDNLEEEYSYKVIIGTKGDRDEHDEIICSKTSPSLRGDAKAIAKYGIGSGYGFLGFYDGIAKAPTLPPIDIDPDEVEEDYEIITGDETIGSTEYVTQFLDQRDLVKNNTTGAIYKTFQKAFNEATDGDELETLRHYTNTKTNSPIVIPATSNFTLKIKHLITVNNELFIENNGNATFVGINNNEYNGQIYSNVTGNIFVNNAQLTFNNLKIENTKATNNRNGVMLLNNSTGTMNINGSELTTIQHTVINNNGTLNVDKTGSDSCYNTTRIKIGYVNPTCSAISTSIINNGTANIDYMTLKSDVYCDLINNYGNMTINHSTLDQSSNTYEPNIDDGSMDQYMVNNQNGNISLKNSTIIFVPNKATYTASTYSNRWSWKNNHYLHNYTYHGGADRTPKTTNVLVDNCNVETSFVGFIFDTVNPYDEDLLSNITMSSTTLHSNSYGIMHNAASNITLNNNNVSIRDSIVEYYRDASSSGYYNYLYFHKPYYDYVRQNSSLTINGGTYNSEGTQDPFTYYTPSQISYSTKCSNSSMDNVSLSTAQRTYTYVVSGGGSPGSGYMQSYTNAFTSVGDVTVNNAEINVAIDRNHSISSYSSYLYYDIYGLSQTDSSGYFAAITSFGNSTILDSTIKSSDRYHTAIRGRSNDSVVILGEKDGLNNATSPDIESLTNYPIQSAKIKLYDGIIKSVDDSYYTISPTISIDNLFIDKETGYSITGDRQTRYLVQDDVIENVSTGDRYTNIQTAIDEASNGNELKVLITTVPIDDSVFTINGKTLTIDLNGSKIGNKVVMSNSANVSVYDSLQSETSNIIIDMDDSTLNLTDGNGTIVTTGTSTVNMTGSAKYKITANDNTTINTSSLYSSNSNELVSYFYLHDSSIINIDSSRISTVNLNDDSNISINDTQSATSYISDLRNSSSNTISISTGEFGSIYNGYIDYSNNTYYNGSMTISNVKLHNYFNYNNSSATLNSVTVTSYTYIYGGTVDINNPTFDSLNVYGSSKNLPAIATVNGGTIDALSSGYNGTINVGTSTVTLTGGVEVLEHVYNYNNAVLNVLDAKIDDTLYNQYITNSENTHIPVVPVLNIGVKDGNVSTTTPIINSKTTSWGQMAALVNSGGTINFYDGIVTGTTSKGAIEGLINEVEPDYKISVVDNGNDTESAYLTPISSADPRVAMVLGINYNSLQTAINKSVMNCTQGSTCPKVTIYLNIELDADLTIADGYSVDINSNGYTISTNNYNVPSTITLDGQPIGDPDNGGSIVNGIKGMLGLDTNTKNVLVYEMSDGSALSTENHYRLYSYTDGEYKLVDMEKGEEVARYNPGKGLTNMKPIKGRLYLTNLKPGSYKVTDDNNSEVTFTINEDGTLSGHVKEYIPKEEKIEATGEAKLIISIQTGIRRVNYMLMAISIIAVLSIMFVLKRKSQNNKNLV